MVALLGTTAMAAKWRDHSPEDRAAWATQRVAERLELDDAQKAAFEKVAGAAMEIRGSRAEFMMELSGKLNELSKDKTLTVEEVNTLRDQIKAEFDKRADVIIPEFVTFYNSLDDKQRTMVTARLEQMTERMENGMRGHKDGRKSGWGEKGEHRGEHRKMNPNTDQ